MDLKLIAFVIVALIVGIVIGFLFKKASDERNIEKARLNADVIVDDAIKQAQILKREALFEAKEENLKYRNEVEEELKERRNEVSRSEARMIHREENLDNRSNLLDQRDSQLEAKLAEFEVKQQQLVDKEQEIGQLIQQQEEELYRVAAMSPDEAKAIVLKDTEESLLSLIHISEPTRREWLSRMPSSA